MLPCCIEITIGFLVLSLFCLSALSSISLQQCGNIQSPRSCNPRKNGAGDAQHAVGCLPAKSPRKGKVSHGAAAGLVLRMRCLLRVGSLLVMPCLKAPREPKRGFVISGTHGWGLGRILSCGPGTAAGWKTWVCYCIRNKNSGPPHGKHIN